MILAIDFDNTLVVQHGRPYDDVTSPFVFMPGAKEALASLKRAGHQVIVWSGRSSLALRQNVLLDPLVRAGKKQPQTGEGLKKNYALNQARFDQMVSFCETELKGLIDAIDDGTCGKVTADIYLDDRAMRLNRGLNAWTWFEIAKLYGFPPDA